MAINEQQYKAITANLSSHNATLVAVSKTKPIEDIQSLYALGQRDFGENYVQELTEKQAQLPADIRWHFIGHLQSNKVKYIIPFVHLIHGVDDYKLLKEINKQAAKHNRVVDCLLQVHIAKEETKFGLNDEELKQATNTYIQTNVDEKMRGRVISYYVMAFQGMQPVGSFLVGASAHYFSGPHTVLIEGIAGVIVSLSFIPYFKRARKAMPSPIVVIEAK